MGLIEQSKQNRTNTTNRTRRPSRTKIRITPKIEQRGQIEQIDTKRVRGTTIAQIIKI